MNHHRLSRVYIRLIVSLKNKKYKGINHLHYFPQNLQLSVGSCAGSPSVAAIFHPACGQCISGSLKFFTVISAEPVAWKPMWEEG